jgi:hypothetical protein
MVADIELSMKLNPGHFANVGKIIPMTSALFEI